MRHKQLFNNYWSFSKHPIDSTFADVVSDTTEWMSVTLPHDWLIYDSHNLYENSEGWYCKTLHIAEPSAGSRISLYFEGVYMNSTLFVNGQVAGKWKYGYSSFEIDLTPFLVQGDNKLVMRVVHQSPNSRWYSGAGIYRNVWLLIKPQSQLATHGIYIATRRQGDSWLADIDAQIILSEQAGQTGSYRLIHKIIAEDETVVAEQVTAFSLKQGQLENVHSMEAVNRSQSKAFANAAAEDNVYTVQAIVEVKAPLLWSLEHPHLYKLETSLYCDEQLLDRDYERFGFRSLRFTANDGFFLNDQAIKLFGVCQHHDLGALGAAVNRKALRRQIQLLKEMGVNAIRTAHNMPAVELMELADEMGVLICSEAFDMWERSKTTYDYARFYSEWWQKDIASWVLRDRNHPSLMMWSIGNEIYDTHASERGQELTRELMELVQQLDYKSNAVVTIGSNFMPWENAQKCADIVKVAGYNYGEKYYDQHHKQHPDWIIYGSETASVVQSRGIYHFPLSQPVLADDDEQCSALGNSSTSWGAKSTEACIIADRDATYSLGQFIWTGFDYIGEPTPYHTKNSYFGQIDTAGFKKDSFYIYQAEWTDYRKQPMVHIFPYWDFSEGQLIDVRVCSNAPKIELFFNEQSQGVVHIDHQHGQKLIGDWQLPYTKGVLRAVAYNEHDEVIATDEQSSFGDAAAIVLHTQESKLAADGSDLAFIEISAVDQHGLPVQNANNIVHVSIDGPGRLVGLDNGDSTDYDSYKGTARKLFSGKLLAIVASTLEAGEITVRAAARGLQDSTLTILSSNASLSAAGLSAATSVTSPAGVASVAGSVEDTPLYAYASQLEHDFSTLQADVEADPIPVRKIELIAPQGTALSAELKMLPIELKLHPESASYNEVEWRLTNVTGADAGIAKLLSDGHAATVQALSDGEVYIRCGTKNGSEKLQHYATLGLNIKGIGEAFLQPYDFVSAGYCSERSSNLTMGNERGVATARDGKSIIYFENIDFGSYGADEVTLPIFSLDGEYFTMELWEGHPEDEDAQPIATLSYQKPSRWNVYQPETYKLNKRLRGITSLSLVLNRKIHLKGFQFTKLDKAFEQIQALEYDQLYGDSYTIAASAIESIGNNVSIIYDDMDFGTKGAGKLTICGHSPIDKNTIHMMLIGADGESKQIVEFTHSSDYEVQNFELEPIYGLQKVMFVFLPGSNFNLQWFQFH